MVTIALQFSFAYIEQDSELKFNITILLSPKRNIKYDFEFVFYIRIDNWGNVLGQSCSFTFWFRFLDRGLQEFHHVIHLHLFETKMSFCSAILVSAKLTDRLFLIDTAIWLRILITCGLNRCIIKIILLHKHESLI